MNVFQQEWEPTESDIKAAELARIYHDECEAYDRKVCTGTGRDVAMPTSPLELWRVNRNARNVYQRIVEIAAEFGIGEREMHKAIIKHGDTA